MQFIQQYELPPEVQERYDKLFKQLDRNGDGRVDVGDLESALAKMGIEPTQERVQVGTFAVVCLNASQLYLYN